MEKKLSLKSYTSKEEVLVNNYVINFNRNLQVQANNIERQTFSNSQCPASDVMRRLIEVLASIFSYPNRSTLFAFTYIFQ